MTAVEFRHLRQAVSATVSRRFCRPTVSERLGVTLAELARLIGVARNTLTAKSSARKVDSALSQVVRILAMASEMAGDENRATIWFKHQPIPGWAGKTAYDLVERGQVGQGACLSRGGAVRRLCLIVGTLTLWRAFVPQWALRRFRARVLRASVAAGTRSACRRSMRRANSRPPGRNTTRVLSSIRR